MSTEEEEAKDISTETFLQDNSSSVPHPENILCSPKISVESISIQNLKHQIHYLLLFIIFIYFPLMRPPPTHYCHGQCNRHTHHLHSGLVPPKWCIKNENILLKTIKYPFFSVNMSVEESRHDCRGTSMYSAVQSRPNILRLFQHDKNQTSKNKTLTRSEKITLLSPCSLWLWKLHVDENRLNNLSE